MLSILNHGDEHLVHLDKVLLALKSVGLTASPTKCEWGGKKMRYLGHLVGSGTVAVPSDRVTTMSKFVRPTTKKGLCSFLGTISYYRKFIRKIAEYTALLTPATTKTAPSNIQWDDGMVSAFYHLCSVLSNACMLTVPTSQDEFVLQTDASVLGVGAVLSVIRDGQELLVSFYARQTQGAEKSYSANELEALGIVCAVEHFSHYLYTRCCKVFTDHKALCSLLSSNGLNRR